MKPKTLYNTSMILVILGAIVTGIYGLTGVEIIDYVFVDDFQIVAEILDTLIGAGGVYLLYVNYIKDKTAEKK